MYIFLKFVYDSHREREREAETQAEGEAGSMHREPDVWFDPGSPGSRPGPKAGAKPLRHPGIPILILLMQSDPESDVLIMVIITTLYYYLTGICIGHFIIIVPVV